MPKVWLTVWSACGRSLKVCLHFKLTSNSLDSFILDQSNARKVKSPKFDKIFIYLARNSIFLGIWLGQKFDDILSNIWWYSTSLNSWKQNNKYLKKNGKYFLNIFLNTESIQLHSRLKIQGIGYKCFFKTYFQITDARYLSFSSEIVTYKHI